jgi:hypothetical protein
MKKGIFAHGGEWYCPETVNDKNNCSCLENNWEIKLNNICTQLGDCGDKKNYLGQFGYAYDFITKQIVSTTEE